jgi:hypothetical protein
MAVVIHQQPSQITPAYNDSWVVAYSNQYTQPNFKYIVEITVNGSTTRLDIAPRPDGGCVFNCKEIVSNYIQRPFDFTPLIPAFDWTDNYVYATVTITEYYSDAEHSSASISNLRFFDACYYQDYFLNDFTDNLDGDWNDISVINDFFAVDNRVTADTDVWLKATVNDLSASPIVGVDVLVNDGFKGYFNVIGTQCMMNIGARVVANYNGGSINIGDVVTINILTESAEILQTITYTITSICSKYPIKRVYYYDRVGQIKYFNFDLVSTKNINKQTNSVRLNRNRLTVGSPLNSYGYNTWDREKFVVSTETTKQITLNSNWISETQSNKLIELFDSPFVWLFEDNQYKPVTVTDNSYNVKTAKVDKAFNYSLTCEYSETETRQRAI